MVICIDYTTPPGQATRTNDDGSTEYGQRPDPVSRDTDCAECGQRHDIEKCPICGSWIEHGFGLAGGGFGAYKYCPSDGCGWIWKRCGPIDER